MSAAAKTIAHLTALAALAGALPAASKRPITVADIIGMTRVAGTPYFAYRPKSGFASFSPDGKQFAIVLARGNVAENTNDYSLMLFRTADEFEAGPGKLLVKVSSASNQLGMFDLEWSGDSAAIYFLGTYGSGPTELYSVECGSGAVKQITDEPAALISFSVSADGTAVAFEAERAPRELLSPIVMRTGFPVGNEELSDLIRGLLPGVEPQLFIKKQGHSAAILRTRGELRAGYGISLSPDGRYLALLTDSMDLPNRWRRYQNSDIQAVLRAGFRRGNPTGIMQYELIDTETGDTQRLLDAPALYCPTALWSRDSNSVILCNTYLPLDVEDRRELEARESKRFIAEIALATHSIATITDAPLTPVAWNSRESIVELESQQMTGNPQGHPASVFYQKSENQWHSVANSPVDAFPYRPAVYLDEDLNRPPQIVVEDPRTARHVRLLDLNPSLSRLELGHVELFRWSDGFGKPISGALYLPAGYIPGERFPLVIQTHGFDPHASWLDGPYSSGFAAQVLAGRGIAVLQMNDIFFDSMETLEEAPRVMKTYENAVDALYRKGIIDPKRVGLLGFSRTCYYVEYTLTHSKMPFAAAAAIDGMNASYLQYLVAAVSRPFTASEFDALNGSPPFGKGLKSWLARSPGFLLDRVRAPLLVEAFGPASVLDEWQELAGLRQLKKPVDLLYLPDGVHVLVKPWDRLASQGAVADWFYFWLAGKEDPDPAKADQYLRWRKLRRK